MHDRYFKISIARGASKVDEIRQHYQSQLHVIDFSSQTRVAIMQTFRARSFMWENLFPNIVVTAQQTMS
jgi:hypothetical protein